MNILYSIILSLLITTIGQAKVLTLNEILESTCRVNAGNSYGSGTCIKYQDNKYYVLTNAHVVGGSRTVRLEFFKNGHKTLPIPATVVFKKLVSRSDIDFAIVAVDAKYFGNYPPRVANIAPRGAIADNQYMLSAGCPSARWANAWEGTIKGFEGGRVIFYPPPVGGQSGSGLYIVNNGNTVLKGVVTWRVGNSGRDPRTGYLRAKGAAINIDRLYDAVAGRVEYNTIPDNYEVVNVVRTSIQDEGAYAHGSDGKFYPVIRGYVTKPDNVQILSYHINRVEYDIHGWSAVQPVQGCPPGGCPPIQPFGGRFRGNPAPSPGSPYLKPIPPRGKSPAPSQGGRGPSNPYDFLPDRDGSGNPTKPLPDLKPIPPVLSAAQIELKKVKAEKVKLEASLKKANADISGKVHEIADLNTQIEEAKRVSGKVASEYVNLAAEKAELNKQKKALEAAAVITQEELIRLSEAEQRLVQQVIDRDTQLIAQNETLATKDAELGKHKELIDNQAGSLADADDEREILEDHRGYLAVSTGTLGIGVLLFFLRNLYTSSRRKKVQSQVDKFQDKVQDKVSDVAGDTVGNIVRGIMEAFESRISRRIDTYQGRVDQEINHIHTKIENTTITHNQDQSIEIDIDLEDERDSKVLDGVYDILGKLGQDIQGVKEELVQSQERKAKRRKDKKKVTGT